MFDEGVIEAAEEGAVEGAKDWVVSKEYMESVDAEESEYSDANVDIEAW